MQIYIAGYHNVVVRMLHSFFIEMPLTVWFRFLSRLIPSGNAQFNNYTSVPTSALLAQWTAAQTNLSTNPFPSDAYNGPNYPADKRALTVQPKNVTVVSVPDVSLSDLEKIDPKWSKHVGPSGTILIIQNGLAGYETVHAVTLPYARPRVYAAASEIPQVLSYEFENIILSQLGYDVSNR